MKTSASYTVAKAVDDWAAEALDGLADKTVRSHVDLLKPVTILIGNIPLRDLSAHDVRRALHKLAEERSTRTMASTHNVLMRAIRHAEANDHVGRNAASPAMVGAPPPAGPDIRRLFIRVAPSRMPQPRPRCLLRMASSCQARVGYRLCRRPVVLFEQGSNTTRIWVRRRTVRGMACRSPTRAAIRADSRNITHPFHPVCMRQPSRTAGVSWIAMRSRNFISSRRSAPWTRSWSTGSCATIVLHSCRTARLQMNPCKTSGAASRYLAGSACTATQISTSMRATQ